jgi:hypothetical protein
MEYRISNTNQEGIPAPDSKVIISLTVPNNYVEIPSNIDDWDWTLISDSCTLSSGADCETWLKEEYDISDGDYESENIGERTIIKELDAYIFRDVNDEFTIYAPLELESSISPSVLSLPFYVRASYDYLLDGQGVGSTTLGVEPRGV